MYRTQSLTCSTERLPMQCPTLFVLVLHPKGTTSSQTLFGVFFAILRKNQVGSFQFILFALFSVHSVLTHRTTLHRTASRRTARREPLYCAPSLYRAPIPDGCYRGCSSGGGVSARIYAAFHDGRCCPPFRVSGCGLDFRCYRRLRRRRRSCRGGGFGQRLGRRVCGNEGNVNCYENGVNNSC